MRSLRPTASRGQQSAGCSNRQKKLLLHLYRACSKGVPQGTPQLLESKPSKSALLLSHKVWVRRRATPQRFTAQSPSSKSKLCGNKTRRCQVVMADEAIPSYIRSKHPLLARTLNPKNRLQYWGSFLLAYERRGDFVLADLRAIDKQRRWTV